MGSRLRGAKPVTTDWIAGHAPRPVGGSLPARGDPLPWSSMGGSGIRAHFLGQHQYFDIGGEEIQPRCHRRCFKASRVIAAGARTIVPLHQWQLDAPACHADVALPWPCQRNRAAGSGKGHAACAMRDIAANARCRGCIRSSSRHPGRRGQARVGFRFIWTGWSSLELGEP